MFKQMFGLQRHIACSALALAVTVGAGPAALLITAPPALARGNGGGDGGAGGSGDSANSAATALQFMLATRARQPNEPRNPPARRSGGGTTGCEERAILDGTCLTRLAYAAPFTSFNGAEP